MGAWWRCFALALGLSVSARALAPAERALLEKSIRPGELAGVEAATGGLDSLALVVVDVTFEPENRTIAGSARIDWRNSTPLPVSELPIRLAANGPDASEVEISDVSVAVAGGPMTTVAVRAASSTIRTITLPKAVGAGERVVVTCRLTGTLGDIAAGATDPVQASFGALMGGNAAPTGDQYGTFACGDGICTATGFAPEVPAFLDGHFDTEDASGIGDATYSEPKNVLLSVVAPSNVVVTATGLEVGRVPSAGGLRRWSFALAAARDVGFVASRDFVVDKATVDGVTVRSFSRSGDRASGKRALEAAKSALQVLDRRLGRYPWAGLDIAESALVGGAGGVEMPALALGASGFYKGPSGMLAMADPSGSFLKDTLAFITRHEVAHQWWHAQVGSHSQKHPYVDEPLAQWSALVATRQALGAAAAKKARDTQIALNFQALGLMGLSDGVVARPAGEFQSMIEYAGLVYGKAPLFYEAAEKRFGEEALAKGLKAVVTKYRFKRVTPDELVQALAASGGHGVDALWTRWMEETHGAEDVGELDLGGLMGAFGGMGGLRGAAGAGALKLPPGLFDPDGDPNVTPAEAMKMLQQFMQELDGQ